MLLLPGSSLLQGLSHYKNGITELAVAGSQYISNSVRVASCSSIDVVILFLFPEGTGLGQAL